ncbi:hypothetical protein EAI_00457 [Harpegnathos saltator]|uniref:Sarcospan n=1 Tax=Harpegnathos saltator TaxID=610380 RepID=E2BKA6_HARSA|nr:hypothetical protein EAI_00457 [Harpegnathos saltator]
MQAGRQAGRQTGRQAGRHRCIRDTVSENCAFASDTSDTAYGPEKFLPPLVYYRRTARCLATLQTILGIAVIVLSLWLLLWTPSLPVINNPYWSGIPLLLSGSFGISLLCCFKKEYPSMRPGICLSTTKAISVFLAVLATVACITACVSSTMHLSRLMELECTPARLLNATCVCRPRGAPPDSFEFIEGAVRYVDLNCPDVQGILTILLIFSSVCNGLSALVAGWYSYVHWSTRQKRPQAQYRQVRTNAVYTNKPLNSGQIYRSSPAER